MCSRPVWLRELRLSADDHPLQGLAGELDRLIPLSTGDRQAVLVCRPGSAGWTPEAISFERDRSRHAARSSSTATPIARKSLATGSRQILAVCIPGDAVDLQNIFFDIADHSVQMMTVGHWSMCPGRTSSS